MVLVKDVKRRLKKMGRIEKNIIFTKRYGNVGWCHNDKCALWPNGFQGATRCQDPNWKGRLMSLWVCKVGIYIRRGHDFKCCICGEQLHANDPISDLTRDRCGDSYNNKSCLNLNPNSDCLHCKESKEFEKEEVCKEGCSDCL